MFLGELAQSRRKQATACRLAFVQCPESASARTQASLLVLAGATVCCALASGCATAERVFGPFDDGPKAATCHARGLRDLGATELLNRGAASLENGHPDEALPCLRILVDRYPSIEEGTRLLGYAHYETANYEDAAFMLNTLGSEQRTALDEELLAMSLARLGSIGPAYLSLLRAINSDPTPAALADLRAVQQSLERRNLNELLRYIENKNEKKEYLQASAVALSLKESLVIDPSIASKSQQAELSVGLCRALGGRAVDRFFEDRRLATYEDVMRYRRMKGPPCADVMVAAALLDVDAGRFKSAAQRLERVVRLRPSWSFVPKVVAQLYVRSGDLDRAREYAKLYRDRSGKAFRIDDDGLEVGERKVKTAKPLGPPRVSTGTGFFVGTGRYVITNQHVVAGARRVEVLPEGQPAQTARVIATDETNDLAVLQIQNPGVARPLRSGPTELGERVFSIGYPDVGALGVSPKFTSGDISGLAGPSNDSRFFQISLEQIRSSTPTSGLASALRPSWPS